MGGARPPPLRTHRNTSHSAGKCAKIKPVDVLRFHTPLTSLSVLILAAGEGTRMKSDLPKVLHSVAGKALVEHVLDAVAPLGGGVGVVLGRGAEMVKERLSARKNVSFFIQKERRGSGDAVRPAARWLERRGGNVLVLCGDAPLVRTETLRALTRLHRREKNAATLLTAEVPNPSGYGRIRREKGRPVAIVEHKEATPAERDLREINSGTYCFRAIDLLEGLRRLRPDNAKGEYYITDVIGFLVGRGRSVGALCLADGDEILGVNNRRELADAGQRLNRRTLDRLMDEGVTVVDPATTYVDATVRVGSDTVIEPQTFLVGATRVGRHCRIGPMTRLINCRLADHVYLEASFGESARVETGARVGPWSRLRPGAVVGRDAHVGNFVELKKTRLGVGAKVNHLSYLGDAVVGARVNVGAGVITCNYDGHQKHSTTIGAEAFIGSNVNLVAPLRVGAGAVVGAGSTLTKDVPAGSLALERAPALIKRGWAKKRRAEKTGQTHG
ncbi:MAG: bifunctional UDP-N-acetylglucosamine diphosphorylase/glucosamine-1-phosphate N-acetyltransferase GlmU [Elusimicrobia bacterium]|nr:bifunctional UDP-N-acetylglucosamine diphosphorylase/glucosamine-1-phosphate N-acetyltransferase GlmU [Elusimicrobiota bacterium]